MAVWKCREKGFSLLELMVAIAIFGSSVAALLAVHSAAARHEAHARNLFTAASLLRHTMAEVELSGYPEIGEAGGDFGEKFPGFRWRRTVIDAPLDVLLAQALGGASAQSLGIAIPAGLGGLREVRTDVLWEEGGAAREVSATFYTVEP
jgi:prepilin-type N-terminal cleavage/methylation domain-containing protein